MSVWLEVSADVLRIANHCPTSWLEFGTIVAKAETGLPASWRVLQLGTSNGLLRKPSLGGSHHFSSWG